MRGREADEDGEWCREFIEGLSAPGSSCDDERGDRLVCGDGNVEASIWTLVRVRSGARLCSGSVPLGTESEKGRGVFRDGALEDRTLSVGSVDARPAGFPTPTSIDGLFGLLGVRAASTLALLDSLLARCSKGGPTASVPCSEVVRARSATRVAAL